MYCVGNIVFVFVGNNSLLDDVTGALTQESPIAQPAAIDMINTNTNAAISKFFSMHYCRITT